MVRPFSNATLTLSFLPRVTPAVSRIEAADAFPFFTVVFFPSAMTVTGPSCLITIPPVNWL